jgi:hypothetical protein
MRYVQRIAQPDVQRFSRSLEQRDGWVGLALVLTSVALLICGARHLTGLSTTDGETASERQLVKAFSSGGLHASNPAAMPAPSVLNDSDQRAAAFDKFQRRDRSLDKLTYRVDTTATTPCPT